jgi:endonuclease/exonuclease/phosphatase family metal-dependent hydrolase
MVLDQEVWEPTLLAIAIAVTGWAALLALCVVAMAGLPAFGYLWWTFAGVATCLVCLVVGFRRKPRPGSLSPTGRQRWLRRIFGGARWLFITVLVFWLGVIGWSAFCRGGPAPPAKADPGFIRVVTWNIHCGQDEGPPWKRFDWPRRKQALRAALDQARPDILCVQEATPAQVAFLEETLPGHRRVGIGRDGQAGGEHCAVYFNQQRFTWLAGSTFWLEEPIDQPGRSAAPDAKRICTWVRLRDQVTGRLLRVYNAHLYLWEAPRRTAARLILAHIAAGDPTDAVLLTADFNATPSAPSRRLFTATETGLASAMRGGQPGNLPTFHMMYGVGLWGIDDILLDRHWGVRNHRILDVKPRNTFPSDHFGLLADLALAD